MQDGGWILVAPDGASLHLSAQERTFLMALMDAAAAPSAGRRWLVFLPESPGGFELRRIDVLVSRLRAKAQSAGLKLPVLSVRGQGYVFAA